MEKCEGGIVRRERRENRRVGHKGMYVCTLSTHTRTPFTSPMWRVPSSTSAIVSTNIAQ